MLIYVECRRAERLTERRFSMQILSEIIGYSNDIRASEVVVMDSKSVKLVQML